MRAELRGHAAERLILSLLETAPRHGYDLQKLIQSGSRGGLTFDVASLYPLLYGLEARGWIEARWIEQRGTRRRYYGLATGMHTAPRGVPPRPLRLPVTRLLVAPRAVGALAVGGLTAGCATAGATGQLARESTDVPHVSHSTVVTAQELAALDTRGSLLAALQRLRPSMLASRGTREPRVSIDGAPPAELSILATIPASIVREVRLERSSSAAGHAAVAPNGSVVVDAIIVVTTR